MCGNVRKFKDITCIKIENEKVTEVHEIKYEIFEYFSLGFKDYKENRPILRDFEFKRLEIRIMLVL